MSLSVTDTNKATYKGKIRNKSKFADYTKAELDTQK